MTAALVHKVTLSPDSGTYLGMSLVRSALYPLFLRACFLFFPEDTLRPVLFLQMLLAVGAALFLTWALHSSFAFKKQRLVEFLMFLLFLSPNLDVCQPFWRDILSESLAYPLWLVAAGDLILFLKKGSVRACKHFFVLTALLVLTRRQFLFLYPVILLLLLGLFTFLKPLVEKKHRWPLVLWAVFSIVGADLAERGYHLAVHGAFRHVPFVGQQAIIAPTLFIGPQGANCLEDPTEKAIYSEICDHLPKTGKSLQKFWSCIEYSGSYLPWNGYAMSAASHHIEKGTSLERYYKADATLFHITIQLVLHYPVAFARYLNRMFLLSYFVPERYGFGGILFLFAAFLCLCVHLYRTVSFRERVLLGGGALLFCSNVLATALVEPLLARYTLYTDVFLGAVVTALVLARKPTEAISAIDPSLKISYKES
jgi:hypothetical protein